MRKKKFCEVAVLLCCLALLAVYSKTGVMERHFVAKIRHGGSFIVMWIRKGVMLEKTTMTEAVEQRQQEEQLAAERELRRQEILRENEDLFYEAAGQMEVIGTEAEKYYRILCRDNVFRDGDMELTGLAIYDIDQNGQNDMAVMLEDTTREGLSNIYDAGCIYFYMNGEEPYCFQEEGFPCAFGFNLSSADLDNDGNMELVFEAHGTGCGGPGDWYGRVLKYENHTMEEMTLPSESAEETSIGILVQQEMKENTYSAYCPYFDETIVFEAPNVFEPYGGGGANCRGFYDLHCVKYGDGSAVEASEYLYGEGGHAHGVGMAKFIIVWDEEGNSRIDKWWIEPRELY